jgi:molybdopterin-dependent oxidoreductase alpha subunit
MLRRARGKNRTPIAGWAPFGLGQTKPHHFWEIFRTVWENRASLPYAWRILRHGVCDGCSLGPRGLRDDAMEGLHLCLVRLKMLRLNTLPALDTGRLADAAKLAQLDGAALRDLGRLPYPMLRRAGDAGFRRIGWEEAERLAAERLLAARRRSPDRIAIYTTSRGLTNESYYVAQKAARLLGTNNIDNAARLCHAASTVALKQTIGVGASTVSYTDWLAADLIVLWGSDVANNQPVAMKYLYYARQRGARVVVINPLREPGLARYWVPSVAKSAVFGTKMADEFFDVRVGGDVAFSNGVLKWLLELGGLDEEFIAGHTAGFAELRHAVEAQEWAELEAAAGVSRERMRRFAELYSRAEKAVFIWSMGLTQHTFGVENVKAVVNLALARGMLGREGAGLVPVRGHSGVQGGAECGSVPNAFPGGAPVDEANAARFAELWGVPREAVPARPGLSAPEMLEAAGRGELDVLWIAGGNFLETMPEPARVEAALARVPCRLHQDLVVNSAMLAPPPEGGFVLLLPAATRYEQAGGGTITSTERRIRFSPEIPGPRIGEARAEWEIFQRIARAALPAGLAAALDFRDAAAIRAEMDRVMPLYAGIAGLAREGDAVQYGGPLLCAGGVCAGMPGGRARFSALVPPRLEAPARGENVFYLATRRGKQFNSMIWARRDPLTGAARDELLISAHDAARLGLRAGDAVTVRSVAANPGGAIRLRCRIAPVAAGTLQAFWPEANPLISSRLDPASHEPDYNAWVTIAKV